MKSCGKRWMFRWTAWISTFVDTSYNAARSTSSMTLCARTNRMRASMCSAGIDSGFMRLSPDERAAGGDVDRLRTTTARRWSWGFPPGRTDAPDLAGAWCGDPAWFRILAGTRASEGEDDGT